MKTRRRYLPPYIQTPALVPVLTNVVGPPPSGGDPDPPEGEMTAIICGTAQPTAPLNGYGNLPVQYGSITENGYFHEVEITDISTNEVTHEVAVGFNLLQVPGVAAIMLTVDGLGSALLPWDDKQFVYLGFDPAFAAFFAAELGNEIVCRLAESALIAADPVTHLGVPVTHEGQPVTHTE